MTEPNIDFMLQLEDVADYLDDLLHMYPYGVHKEERQRPEVVRKAIEYIKAMQRENSDMKHKLLMRESEAIIHNVDRWKAKAPVFKTGESVLHVSYADGRSGFETQKWADWTCPECGWFVGEQYIPRRHNQQKSLYCSKCGQAIDWAAVEVKRDAAKEC